MSDRHSAEKKFNSLLEDYREKTLSEVKIGWNDLSDEEKSGIVYLNSFFCGMHLMVGMAECANQALIEAEKAILGPDVRAGATKIAPSYCSAKEAGTIRLIRTVCNASCPETCMDPNGQVCILFLHNTCVPKGWIT